MADPSSLPRRRHSVGRGILFGLLGFGTVLALWPEQQRLVSLVRIDRPSQWNGLVIAGCPVGPGSCRCWRRVALFLGCAATRTRLDLFDDRIVFVTYARARNASTRTSRKSLSSGHG